MNKELVYMRTGEEDSIVEVEVEEDDDEEEEEEWEEEEEEHIDEEKLNSFEKLAYERKKKMDELNKQLIKIPILSLTNSNEIEESFVLSDCNEAVIELYKQYIFDKNVILTFHSPVAASLEINCERIISLINILSDYEQKFLNEDEMEMEILCLYSHNPYLLFQVATTNQYYSKTPALGLCWIIAEYQAYYRGRNEPSSSVDTWGKYSANLASILEEASNLMVSQMRENYKEACRINDKRSIEFTHSHFLKDWNNKQKKRNLCKSGIYKQKAANGEYRWGSDCGFGTLFFTGTGTLESAPLANYFISNDVFNYREIYNQENFCRLCEVFPYGRDYTHIVDLQYFKLFSLNDIGQALNHNNSIIFSKNHFYPIDWPLGFNRDSWCTVVQELVSQTALKLKNMKSILSLKGKNKDVLNILKEYYYSEYK